MLHFIAVICLIVIAAALFDIEQLFRRYCKRLEARDNVLDAAESNSE